MTSEETTGSHINMGIVIRMLDGELTGAEAQGARKHLVECPQCCRLSEEVRKLSGQVQMLVASASELPCFADRQVLARRLQQRAVTSSAPSESADRNARFILRRFGWSMAIAASLAIGVMIASHARKGAVIADRFSGTQAAGLEVDGETFIPLPYSNPDLPVNAARVVEMQVPISSLSDAGIVFEPVASGSHTSDRAVLADVLIGVDGQPRGVHILGVE